MRSYFRVMYLLSLLALLLPHTVASATGSDLSKILISEIQTGSTSLASQEFIELYNGGNQAVDISQYRVEYFSASATSFNSSSRSVLLHGTLAPGRHYLLAATAYLTSIADDSFTATLAKTGGHVRLGKPDAANPSQLVTEDLVGWGTARLPEGAAALAPDGGQSLVRKTDNGGALIDTNNNANDFTISAVPTPENGSAEAAPTDTTPDNQPPAADQAPEPAPSSDADGGAYIPPLLAVRINELLPNPAPPATDANDEFVEIYNPNQEAVDLNGYKLQTGNTYSYSFTFVNESLPAQAYKAFYVSLTNDLLANSGGKARLIAPSGQVVSETDAYKNAGDGDSWMFDGSKWQWTNSPTPGAPNILSQTAAGRKTSLPSSIKPTAKKPAASSTPKVKAATSTKVKKIATSASTGRSNYQTPPVVGNTLHPSVLAGVGGLTLIYAGYEYRHDALNCFQRFRRYRASRRARGQVA